MIRADKIVLSAVIFYIITLCTTNFYINYKSNIAKSLKIDEKVVHEEEQNILFKLLIRFENVRYIYSVVIIPALLISIYYYCRKKYRDANPELLEAIAIFFFTSYLYDSLNNISILLGILIK